MGRGEEAVGCFEAAKRLSPLDTTTWYFDSGIGISFMRQRRYADALPWLEGAVRQNATAAIIRRSLAIAYAHLGRMEDAHRLVADAFKKNSREIDLISRLIALAESRRNAALRELDRYRSTRTGRARPEEITEVEYTEVPLLKRQRKP